MLLEMECEHYKAVFMHDMLVEEMESTLNTMKHFYWSEKHFLHLRL